RLDVDTAILLSSEFGFDAEFVPVYSEEAMIHAEVDQPSDLQHRSPIVTVMGHVDHGKTSLLDAIREANVAEKEAGGITQHIGAYKVRIEKGNIVFLDTPGHEAFTAMRARGAQVTDLVVLVVAADDGVKPQTVEAIDHARAAGVPILVAINKIDLPQSKPERVKQELSQYGLSPEEWGGKTIFVEVSAKKRINIDKLLEMLLLESELLELKANPKRSAQGVVIEAKLDPQKGPVATVIVQKGTLRIGNMFVCGLTSGKVKALTDDHGHRILEAGPSTPVEVLGFSETSQLGDRIIVVGSEREAREIIEKRKSLSRDAVVEKKRHLSLEILSAVAKEGKIKELGLIVKADVQGSLEALKDSIERIESPEIRIKVIHTGVGGITESDVSLAAASDAIIIGFSVRPEPAGEELARREGVEIKSYRIIYEVIADIRASLSGLLEPEEKEVSVGRVEVREIFKTPAGKVAGCMVVQGKVNRSSQVRLVRDAKILFEGKIASLRRFKDDVREVEQGFECGLSLENFQDILRSDVLEIFVKEMKARKLE
ncbi:MAG: translation initiation factor IF-2, partial [Elusimicrobia bacterium]|nr:translation initiation factor IF-2 [Elusimicrobiota bacterium]